MQAIIFVGLPATGKSTFYKTHFIDTHIRINLDMLRTRNRETILIYACLAAKQPFVLDNTHPAPSDRESVISLAKAAHFEVVGYHFDVPLEVALARNTKRDTPVHENGIYAKHKQLTPPQYAEGFDVLYHVDIDLAIKMY